MATRVHVPTVTRQVPGTDIMVERYQIITTNIIIYCAFEPLTRVDNGYSHHMISTINGQWMGEVGSGPLPTIIDKLPAYSTERSIAYRAWRRTEVNRAHAAILAVFPEAHLGHSISDDSTEIQSKVCYID